MATSHNFSLTAEEQAIYDSVFKNSLIPEMSDENDRLFREWKVKEKTLESTELLPYADIFFEILKNIFLSRKDEIINSLENKIKTCTDRHSAHVSLFRFNSVEWHESLTEKKKRRSTMTPIEQIKESDADMDLYEMIKRNNWDWTLGTMSSYGGGYLGYKYPYKMQVRLIRLIHKTPILNWMSGLLGPNYQCMLESKYLENDFPGQNFYRVQNTIRIRFLPYGHKNKSTLLTIAKCYKEKMERESYTLKGDEILYGNGSWDLSSLTDILKGY